MFSEVSVQECLVLLSSAQDEAEHYGGGHGRESTELMAAEKGSRRSKIDQIATSPSNI